MTARTRDAAMAEPVDTRAEAAEVVLAVGRAPPAVPLVAATLAAPEVAGGTTPLERVGSEVAPEAEGAAAEAETVELGAPGARGQLEPSAME